jgi:hypothetical protein
MSNLRAAAPEHDAAKGSWGEIFHDGRGLYSALVIGGIAMQATQMLPRPQRLGLDWCVLPTPFVLSIESCGNASAGGASWDVPAGEP